MPFIHTDGVSRFSSEKMQKVGLFETPQMFCDLYCLKPGQKQKVHAHAGATKFYYVLEGKGVVEVGGEARWVEPGMLAWAGPGEPHGVHNPGPGNLLLLVSMAPNPNTV